MYEVYFLALANNLCFNVEDGQFNTRSELVDAPTCSIARGAPVLGLGENKCQHIITNVVP